MAALRCSAGTKTEEHKGESFARIDNGQHSAKRIGPQKRFMAVVQAEKTTEKQNELTEREKEED